MSPVYPALQADSSPAEPSGQPKGTLYITGIKSWVKKDTSIAVNTRGMWGGFTLTQCPVQIAGASL